MSDSREQALIGVDGGGTSCRIALLWRGRVVNATLGSANVATDRPAAIEAIRQGLVTIAAKVDLTAEDLREVPAYLGLAGVLGPEDARQIARALPLDVVQVEADRSAAVVGALGDADGVVAGLGTGSFLGRQSGGTIRFVGGWGFVLGDQASGAWLGRAALAMVLQVVDGLRAPSPLTDQLFARFGNAPDRLVTFGFDSDPAGFAALAPGIVAAAEDADPAGIELMQAGAAYLKQAINTLGWQPGEPLCLIGGLGRFYAPFLPDQMVQSVTPPKGTALDGALHLAERLAARQRRAEP